MLTRQDYIRYESRRQALSGIVQSLLITKKMLFVGFSLQDDNFHRILDSVKRVAVQDKNDTLGTALFLLEERFLGDLFQGDINLVSMLQPTAAPTGDDWGHSARLLEIFVDYVSSQQNRMTSYLLDAKFSSCLSKADIKLRDEILDFMNNVSPEAQKSEHFKELTKMIYEKFGRPQTAFPRVQFVDYK